jgi:hypothetical protein
VHARPLNPRRTRLLLLGLLALATWLVLLPGTSVATGGPSIYTVAGIGIQGDTNDGGQATEAEINQPRSMFATPDGGFVFAEPYSNIVRKVGPDGRITTIAGTGAAGSGGDGGPATAAQLNFVHGAAPTPDGGYLIADTINSRIRRIAPNGTITTAAGTGTAGYGGDGGPATQAMINNPRGLAPLPDGGFIFPDTNNHRIRRVWPDGTITTVAGTGVQGFSGDGGRATLAQISTPFSVAPTSDGGFFFSDNGNARIRRVSPDGTITTVAGTGVEGFSGDGGPATSAQIFGVHNIAAMPDGGFVLADTRNHRVRRVWPDGTIDTIAGDGVGGYSGDGGPATAAEVNYPKAVGITSGGAILISDETNDRIRYVGTPTAPSSVAAPTVVGTPVQNSTLTADAGGWSGTGPMIAYQWQRCDAAAANCTDIAGATTRTYTASAADVGARVRVDVTASNAAGSAASASAATGTVAAAASAPSNTSPPTISGTAAEGSTLTAAPGTWSGTPPIAFSYQWQRCAAGACSDIAGATGTTYAITSADVGATVRVRVGASNSVGASDYQAGVIQSAPIGYWRFDDSNGTLADVRGYKSGAYVNAPTEGTAGLLTGDTDAAVSFNGTSQYADVPADPVWTASSFSIEIVVKPSTLPINKTIWSTQTSTLTGWWLNTGPTGVVRMFVGDGSAFRFDSSGPVLNAGQTYDLVATWDGTTARLYVNGALVSTGPAATMAPAPGATMRFGAYSSGPGQYWPGVLDDASFYSGILSASTIAAHANAALNGSSAVSGQTAVVAATSPQNTAPPVVSGSAVVGQQLSASAGSWTGSSPLAYAYQWQRCDAGGGSCTDIAGATSSSYLLVAADAGSTVRVVVTASNTAGSSSAASNVTGVVAAAATAPANTTPPSVSGSAQQGAQLTASPGSWTGSAPLTYAYQWQRCDAGGSSCSNIAGATSSTYVLAAADVGATVRVTVTASNTAGSTPSTSTATAVVAGVMTFTINAGGDDGNVLQRSGSYPPSGGNALDTTAATVTVARRYQFSLYRILVGLVRFDTSPLPDGATIVSATLKLYIDSRASPDNRNLVAEWYAGSNWPIDFGDWSLDSTANAHPGTPITSLPTAATTNFTLQNLSNISTTGPTGLRLHIDGNAPTGDNYVSFDSFENSTGPHPQLTITYRP